MAVLITIKRIEDTEDFADYDFQEHERKPGRIRIDKSTGETMLVDNAENYSEFIWSRAMRKIRQNWEGGEYPEKTCWAS